VPPWLPRHRSSHPARTNWAEIAVRRPETDVRHQPKSLYDFNRSGCTVSAVLRVRPSSKRLFVFDRFTQFADLPPDGFPVDHLRSRFVATCWEPLLIGALWLWRLSGNSFLDLDSDD
jgi:hypothetical protein